MDIITKYAIAIYAYGELVSTYTWLAVSPEEAERELAAEMCKPLSRLLMDAAFPQTIGATLTFKALEDKNA